MSGPGDQLCHRGAPGAVGATRGRRAPMPGLTQRPRAGTLVCTSLGSKLRCWGTGYGSACPCSPQGRGDILPTPFPAIHGKGPACWLRWLCALLLAAHPASAPWSKHIDAHRSGVAPALGRQPRPPADTSPSLASSSSGRHFNRTSKLSESCAPQ